MNLGGDNQPLIGADGARARVNGELSNPGMSTSPADESDQEHSRPEGNEPHEWPTDAVTAPLRYAAPHGGRKGAILRSLPVIFVLSLVALVVGVFLGLHIAPLLQQHAEDHDAFSRGLGELVAFSIIFILFLTCFSLSVLIRPGSPNETWEDADSSTEIKSGGGARICKWCAMPKPDRTHHCRVCRSCVLRMDHHCPWLANCVGWGNHKYFVLLLLYGTLTCLFVGATMMESVVKVVGEPQAGFVDLFLLLLGVTLDIFLLFVLAVFGSFHMYLMMKGMTTIEFCEKRFRRSDFQPPPDMWDSGIWRNFNEVFGYNPLLWFLPIDNRRGDGKHFLCKHPGLRREEGDLEPGMIQQDSRSKIVG